MEAYQQYPSLYACTINERVKYFKHSALEHLQKGVNPDMALAVADDALEREDYEMVQGIQLAVSEFKQNPQLALL